MLIHVVRPGETVYAIARNYGVDPRRLMADNGVPADGALAVGQTLVLRFPNVVHAVQPGETLTSIARSYGVSVRSLWRNNPELLGGSLLAPGQVLVITYHEEKLGTAVANGYAYPFLSPALLAGTAPFLSYLTPFTYGISRDLGLLPLRDGELLAGARAHGTGAVMHLSTYTEEERFDVQRAEQLLTDAAAQARLLGEIQRTMAEKGFSGLDVDFEYLSGALVEAYAAFLSRLRQALRTQGHFLWAALAPKTRPDQPGTLYEGHDYARVGAATDAVLLMTYEWGYTYGPPMAVAPLPNVRAVLDYAVTEIPAEKILLGVPNYGYDWPLPYRQGETRAESLSNEEAVRRAIRYGAEIQFDESAQAPWYRYTAPDGTGHEVWFEDARAQAAKLRLVAEYGFLGMGYWNIMRPAPQTWLVLSSLYDID